MSCQSSFADHYVSPVQVWARLAADHRRQAIRFMAQLAFNLIVAQSDLLIKEPNHAIPSRHVQDPTGTS